MRHVKHWALVQSQHSAAIDFLDWLDEEFSIQLDYSWSPKGTPMNVVALVDKFLGVDRAGLEKERREILEAQRKMNEE